MMLIPAMDLAGGRCVRLRRGRFDEATEYAVEPDALLARYRDLGATWVHVVDLDGARLGGGAQRERLTTLARATELRLQVGGGVRDAASVASLRAAGVGRIVVGTMALTDPGATRSALRREGPERVALALDVALDAGGTPRVRTHGWTEESARSLWQVLEEYLDDGLRHVLCTDVDRDGMLAGPNVELYREAVQRFPGVAWQASGGVRGAADLAALADTGVAAAISGRALLEDGFTPEELEPWLRSA